MDSNILEMAEGAGVPEYIAAYNNDEYIRVSLMAELWAAKHGNKSISDVDIKAMGIGFEADALALVEKYISATLANGFMIVALDYIPRQPYSKRYHLIDAWEGRNFFKLWGREKGIADYLARSTTAFNYRLMAVFEEVKAAYAKHQAAKNAKRYTVAYDAGDWEYWTGNEFSDTQRKAIGELFGEYGDPDVNPFSYDIPSNWYTSPNKRQPGAGRTKHSMIDAMPDEPLTAEDLSDDEFNARNDARIDGLTDHEWHKQIVGSANWLSDLFNHRTLHSAVIDGHEDQTMAEVLTPDRVDKALLIKSPGAIVVVLPY